MKITAGLGNIDEYIPYVEAGADELFCGYVPFGWMEKAGNLHPLNRREVLYYNVQIGSQSELRILRKMVEKYKVPVSIALNSPFYSPEYYRLVFDVLSECMREGFFSFIVADPALLHYIQVRFDKISGDGKLKGNSRAELMPWRYPEIHVSGEIGEINHYYLQELSKMSCVKRIIYHRKTLISDMRSLYEGARKMTKQNSMQYEAFVLNEMCHYTGAYCNSLHCDELEPTCRLPYRLTRKNPFDSTVETELGTELKTELKTGEEAGAVLDDIESCDEIEYDTVGRSGCGLCALWKLRDAGITYVKLVSRGNYVDDTIRDIKALRLAISIMEHSSSEQEYIREMKKQIFKSGCSGNCYY